MKHNHRWSTSAVGNTHTSPHLLHTHARMHAHTHTHMRACTHTSSEQDWRWWIHCAHHWKLPDDHKFSISLIISVLFLTWSINSNIMINQSTSTQTVPTDLMCPILLPDKSNLTSSVKSDITIGPTLHDQSNLTIWLALLLRHQFCVITYRPRWRCDHRFMFD